MKWFMGCLVVVGLVAFGWHLRADRVHDAGLNAEIRQLDHQRRIARMRADSLEQVQRPQTASAVKWKTRWDSTGLRQLQQTVDSLKAIGTPKPETIPVLVPVSTLATADTAIKTCTLALGTCNERIGAERQGRLAAEAQVTLLKAAQPSRWAPTIHRAQGAVFFGVPAGMLLGLLLSR